MKLTLRGPIINNDDKWFYDYLGWDCITAQDFDQALNSGEDLELNISSEGGLVTVGSEIYTNLLTYPGRVTVNITGLAASAASVIAMAGDEINISPVGRIMIHNVSSGGEGDYHNMDKLSDVLKQSNEVLANAYVKRTGIAKDEILSMMDSETWLSPEQAVNLGFADKIMDSEKDSDNLELVASFNSMVPRATINKLKALVNKQSESAQSAVGSELATTLDNHTQEPQEATNKLETAINKEPEKDTEQRVFRAFLF